MSKIALKLYLALMALILIGLGGYLISKLFEHDTLPSAIWVLRSVAILFSLGAGISAAMSVRRCRADSRRTGFYRYGIFWRYWAYTVFYVIILTLLSTTVYMREISRCMLLIMISLHVIPLVSVNVYALPEKLSPGWRKLSRGVDIAAFNIMLAVILVEISLRVMGAVTGNIILDPPNLKSVFRVDSWRLRPGVEHRGFVANSEGFYDLPFHKAKAAGSLRIFGLADSFGVEPVNYHDNFLTLLEKDLPPLLPHINQVEVMNLGIPQISPAEYLEVLRRYGTVYKPDYSICCIFTGNDITGIPRRTPSVWFLRRNYWYTWFVTKRLINIAAEPPARLQEKLTDRKAGEKDKSTSLTVDSKPVKSKEKTADEAEGTFMRDTWLRVERRRLEVCQPLGQDKLVEEYYGLFFDNLSAIAKEAEGRVLFVVIPDNFQVDDEAWDLLTSEGATKGLNRMRPQEEITSFCREQGLDFLDLTAILQTAQKEQPVYALYDTHWSAAGHRVASKAIAGYLANILLSEDASLMQNNLPEPKNASSGEDSQ